MLIFFQGEAVFHFLEGDEQRFLVVVESLLSYCFGAIDLGTSLASINQGGDQLAAEEDKPIAEAEFWGLAGVEQCARQVKSRILSGDCRNQILIRRQK